MSRPLTLNRTLASLALLGLAGCTTIEAANEAVKDGQALTSKQLKDQRALMRGGVIEEQTPFYGQAIAVKRGTRQGKPLPRKFEAARGIVLNSGGSLNIAGLTAEITEQTGIPFVLKTRYQQPTGGLVDVPIGSKMRSSYTGALSRLMDQIGTKFDVAWHYDGASLIIDRMVTKIYKTPLPAGKTDFTTTMGGATGAGGSSTVTLTRVQNTDPWAALKDRLDRVAPAPAEIKLVPAAGRVEVFGPPTVQARAKQILDDVNDTAKQRIGLDVAVYFVDVDTAESFGVGLNIPTNIGSRTLTLAAAASGTLTGGSATLAHGSQSINLAALAQDSSVVDYRLGSTIAQSGVIAPIVLTRSQNYVSSVNTTAATSTAAATTAVSTATLETGISIHALPRLIDTDQIQLSLTVLQSDLVTLTERTAGGTTLQLPTVDTRALQNEVVLSPGETLILSGYEQEAASRRNSGAGIGRFLGIGGSTGGQVRKVRMVVIVRPKLIGGQK